VPLAPQKNCLSQFCLWHVEFPLVGVELAGKRLIDETLF
jgi:hypothetical protein